jgi:hypothetical protein
MTATLWANEVGDISLFKLDYGILSTSWVQV